LQNVQVLVTSATINADLFTRFFPGARHIQIPGRMFPIELRYLPQPDTNNLVPIVVDAVVGILADTETLLFPGASGNDILVFMTGQVALHSHMCSNRWSSHPLAMGWFHKSWLCQVHASWLQ
jgi:HrpA-like RNA helicase